MSIRMIFASTAALAMVAGTPAFAAKSQNQNRQVAAADAGGGGGEKLEKRTCRSFPNSATRMKREKLCLTRAEWKKFQNEQQ
ncbi:MAG TPA: hypothetical protein VGA98_11330 [Allosphingosinicella sp.]